VSGEGGRLFATSTPANFHFTVVEPASAAALTAVRRDRGKQAR
jgi:hypothetical protein